jgi:hypothetical protein
MKPDKNKMATALLSQILRSASRKQFANSFKPPAEEVAEEAAEGEAPTEGGDDEMAELEALLAQDSGGSGEDGKAMAPIGPTGGDAVGAPTDEEKKAAMLAKLKRGV